MRKIIIYSKQKPNILKDISKELKIRNTKIKYIPNHDKNNLRLELYGYDGKLKWISNNVIDINKSLRTCIVKIDKMPMGKIEFQLRTKISGGYKNKIKKTRKQLLKKCGLPDIVETGHCFADSTHHTCCMLGSRAREYADSSGNPIGSLSVKVQKRIKKTKKNKKGLTPWCTCTGSKVCSYYMDKFGNDDGTHIKFIGDIDDMDENKAIDKLDLMRHRTSGIF